MIRLITFEGGDGTGKTTQIKAAENYLREHNQACVATREPGGTELGKLIRKVLLEVGDDEIAPLTELFLYLADRAQHVSQVIRPAVDAGKIVLCDRFTDSTLVYQGYGRGIEHDWLRRLNDIASEGLRPDITLLFDCPAAVGLARTLRRQAQAAADRPPEDRFEREEIEFHEKVRNGFLELARAEPGRFRIVDATRSITDVARQVREIIDRELA
ncbi:MAG TPA: dTMP kinase [Candidatus Binatia bacterium]